VSPLDLNGLLKGILAALSIFMSRAAEQSLAADGAIAWFSSSLFPSRLNADRAPQLKAIVGWLLNSFVGIMIPEV
jgi:hypothetical protein